MHDIDYTGPQGGALALAFGAGATFATAALMTVGTFIWRVFGDARIKQLELERAVTAENHKLEIAGLNNRIVQLETILLTYGPPLLRRELQAAMANTP
ncbi:hypothetical protein J2X47_004096 [Sphingomonas sp. BE270]|uniref:hypothetical protein n=1 Tax=Sphingomonas sp. BE270 TaxID=2817726 RepID=UPI00285BD083|nr:hypothetical protein [Sphingomonas sp. BE270]MDR7259890.1 hypothetical protein [Sphingomonas sp. BE270]